MNILLFILSMSPVCGMLSCIGDTGAAVDSWFLIKKPTGTAYMYSDSATPLGPSLRDLNSTTTGALGLTLNQLWNNTTEYMLFNDEPLGIDTTLAMGHTKGIWAWSGAEALLLTHSIPLFPAGPSSVSRYRGLGGNAYIYAQHMACFSTTTLDLTRLASLATLTAPGIYDTRITASTPDALRDVASGVRNKSPVCNNTVFQTVGGRIVTYFAKSSQWNNELYANCMAPFLKSSLVAETWIRGSVEGPSCKQYAVLDAKTLNFTGIAWKESQDHSKWAVGVGSAWVCASDINRMLSQYSRGGSSFCYEDVELATILSDAVTSTDSCTIAR